MQALAAALAALVTAGTAAANPPPAGVFVPGISLGGIRLGDQPRRVRALWGSAFGRCRSCAHATWYFNYAPFTPQGAGVEFRRGSVAAVFTLYSPSSWHTPNRLRVGDPSSRVTALYSGIRGARCRSYTALTVRRQGVASTFYVYQGKVWGFGLTRVGVPVCR